MDFQFEKQVVRDYYAEIDRAECADIALVMQRYCAQDYLWRGFHPFNEQTSAQTVAECFWLQVVDHFAINQNFAFRSIFQPGNHAHRRRLTTARGAEQNQKFFICNCQIKVVNTYESAPSLGKISQLNFSHSLILSRSQNHFANVFKLH